MLGCKVLHLLRIGQGTRVYVCKCELQLRCYYSLVLQRWKW